MSASAPVQQQNFLTLLAACEDGALLSELNDRARELIAVMQNEATSRGSKPRGSLALSFEFKLDKGIVEVSADVKVREPKAERSRTIFYRLNDNTLSPNNPKQITMDLGGPRQVEDAREIKIVG